MTKRIWIAALTILSALLLAACGRDVASSSLVVEQTDPEGFARATGPKELTFPEAYGPHPDYQTEWWYYVGNLQTDDGRHFGYQLTFFRRALEPTTEQAERPSDWATNQIYLAHFTVTDVTNEDHRSYEQFSRGAAGLAGAQADPYRVWLEDWEVVQIGPETYQMTADYEGIALDLTLTNLKPPALQGQDGYSQKGPEVGDASYYYSLTRMATEGTVTVDGDSYAVEGFSWKDHEYSTSVLSGDQVGWDWFSVQLDDNTELMFYHVRNADGTVDPLSKGAIIDEEGNVTVITFAEEDYILTVTDTWTSPRTGAEYPNAWTLEIPQIDLVLEIEPLIDDQELDLSYAYWEGAIRVEGTKAGEPVSGFGYAELTGYASSMQNQL